MRTIIRLLVAFCCTSIYAQQDFFVTTKGDTTYCQVKSKSYDIYGTLGGKNYRVFYYLDGDKKKHDVHIDTLHTFRDEGEDYDILQYKSSDIVYRSIAKRLWLGENINLHRIEVVRMNNNGQYAAPTTYKIYHYFLSKPKGEECVKVKQINFKSKIKSFMYDKPEILKDVKKKVYKFYDMEELARRYEDSF